MHMRFLGQRSKWGENLFKKKKKTIGIETMRNRQGYTFILHWIIGLIAFVAVPICESIRYSFSNVSIEATGVKIEFAGLKHFKQILTEDPDYLNNLRNSFGNLIYMLPIILSLSILFAVLLNQNFVGRTVARAVFFLPVILATTNILGLMNTGNVRGSSIIVYSGAEYTYGSIIDFNSILHNLNLPPKITAVFSDYLQNVFRLIFDCGVQIILFLAGLQSIPASFYEVSKIEGASKWEEFWFITVPMLRNIILLVIIYTMIEFFTSNSNVIINQAYGVLRERQIYDLSSAMLCFYFTIGLAIMGALVFLYNKFCMKRWE